MQQWVSRADADDCVLALEDVGNPHNPGAMMRSCAHFGVKGVLLQDAALLESGAAIRTAEGGAEHVQPITGDSVLEAPSNSVKRATPLSPPQAVPLRRCLKRRCRAKWCWC